MRSGCVPQPASLQSLSAQLRPPLHAGCPAENARLKEEKMQLVAQIEILNAKLSMSAFGAMQTLGGAVSGGAAAAAGFGSPGLVSCTSHRREERWVQTKRLGVAAQG